MTNAPVPRSITVWACPCGYWRQERSTGVHLAFPTDGPGVSHELVEVEYVVAAFSTSRSSGEADG